MAEQGEYLTRKETLRDRRQEHRGLLLSACHYVLDVKGSSALSWHPLMHAHTQTHTPYSLPLAPLSYIFPPLEKEEPKTHRSLNNLDIPNKFMKIFLHLETGAEPVKTGKDTAK